MKAWLAIGTLALTVACAPEAERRVLSGSSSLAPLMNEAAIEADVPAEILAAVAVSETALVEPAHDLDEGHVPRGYGVMGLLEASPRRSAARAAALLGIPVERVKSDRRDNVRGAAAVLRAIADELFGAGALGASGSRDRWLLVVERYFDAGRAGAALALEVRRNAARGLAMLDGEGMELIIPSFAQLYADRAPFAQAGAGLAAEYPGATFVAANAGNFTSDNRTAADIDVIVIHTVQGSYASAISWFQNSSANVSAHYVVRRSDGAITQMVRHKDIAWHAGNWSYNQRSIGIEHEGYIANSDNYTPAMVAASADLSRWLCDNLGIPKDRNHIIGHIEVPSATHTDPGQFFPWQDYMQAILNGSSSTPPGNGRLQGVVYIGTDTTSRIPGATVTISPGGAQATARASDAYWSFSLPPGTYTITAAAPGYAPSSLSRVVTSGGDEWGSVGLTLAAPPMNGTLRGVVYDASGPDLSQRISGATVRLSSGQTQTVGSDGSFLFELPPGDYTITATKQGYTTGTTLRTVVAGQIAWGSTGIIPAGTMPTNHAPSVPVPLSPRGGVTTRTPVPVFTVGAITDPDGDALSLEVELYADEGMTAPISTGEVPLSASDRVASWRYPLDDLPRYAVVYWRVRAKDAALSSPFSEVQSFVVPGGAAPVLSMGAWTGAVLPGVGDDAPPPTPTVLSPAALATVATARPRFSASLVTDPDGDPVEYAFEVASDDVFGALEAEGPLGGSDWVMDADLAPGSTYYVRVRAADARLYSAWSSPVAFTVSDSAGGSGEPPATSVDRGGPPKLEATVEDQSGCSAVAPSDPALAALLGLAWILAARRRRSF